MARCVIGPPTSTAWPPKASDSLIILLYATELHRRARCFHYRTESGRTGLTRVGTPGADAGLQKEDPTIADLLKPLGYATGQLGKNHLGDKDEFLPTVHGFDEFFGNLYHLNAQEEPELPDYPRDPEFRKRYGPRGVLHCQANGKGGQKIEDTGPLTKKPGGKRRRESLTSCLFLKRSSWGWRSRRTLLYA
ncbi:sulfatase-like hydrolase/transferase [Nitrosospira sp. Is2]|uniref:sulfatase-like hydrolase/transferase n=1 Tax=Nitrosospira sp. Is2 TaxID=3080532 RepID=UPI0029536155|nr:sulfatase-like hydrolase/transferase [Nitrosospira sp. Is2]WON74321.1 sulfatase-like hydrolase/transferase [Nitrosospira sp. Is2]